IAGFRKIRYQCPTSRHIDSEPHVGRITIESIRGKPLSGVQKEGAFLGDSRQNDVVAIRFRIQYSGVIDVQDRVVVELLIAEIYFYGRVDIELPETCLSTIDGCFVDT